MNQSLSSMTLSPLHLDWLTSILLLTLFNFRFGISAKKLFYF